MRGRRKLHQRYHRLIDELEKNLVIPDPWDFDEFCARLPYHTGRKLKVMPPIQSRPGAPCGLYISTAASDYVYTTAGTTTWHRQHIALHEIGHLLAGHNGGLGREELAQLLLPDLDPAVVRMVLGRTSYTNTQEQEAEFFATRVMQRARLPREHPGSSRGDPAVAGVITRLEDVLGPGDPRRDTTT